MKTLIEKTARFFLVITVVALTGCTSDPAETKTETSDKKPVAEKTIEEEVPKEIVIPKESRAFTYEGTIKGTIPVFIHFTEQDSILSGEITYMNTKAKKPIRILGEIRPNNFYHIMEFDQNALITGIMSLTKKGSHFSGTWFVSGKRNSSLKMELKPSDSIVRKQDLAANHFDVFGNYEYNYTKNDGNTGSFSIEKKSTQLALFEILGVHSAPGYNMASIEETEVSFPSGAVDFDFNIPEYETCDFNVKFYKDFARVKYINGYCQNGYFGHNATVEGLFLKVK